MSDGLAGRGSAIHGPRSEERDVSPQIASVLMTQEGDEYSEVTYSTQRAMAAHKKQTCSWFVRLCVEGIIAHNYA